MNLLMISGFWPTKNNPIAGVFVQQQVEEYQRQGHQVVVVAPILGLSLKRKRTFDLKHADAEIYCPAVLIPPGLSRLPSIVQAILFPVYLRHYAAAVSRTLSRSIDLTSIDAVHANGLTFAGLCLADVPALKGKRSVVTVHGEDPLLVRMAENPRFRRVLARAYERINVVVLCGSPLRSYVDQLGIPHEKIRTIPNGTFLPAKKFSLMNDKKKIILISIANLAEHKNIISNIIAFANLSANYNMEYIIVGDGPQRKFLQHQAEKFALSDRVMFVGRLDHAETMNLLSQADIFSLPSLRDAFPVSFIEAMARGKPVVGSRGTGAEDMIEDGVNGFLVNPREQETVNNAIKQLVKDPDLRLRMGNAGRKTANSLSWESNVKRYVELLQG